MAVASIQRKLTPGELMAALEQLEPAEAEKITRTMLHLQARRRAPNLSNRETELLHEIYREKRPGFQEQFDRLQSKRHEFALSPKERQELLRLLDESEAFTVRRLQALGELAQLRGVSVDTLMKQLGLKAPGVV